jgi:ATP-dependent RNA helicase SUPV3L1/SUV3
VTDKGSDSRIKAVLGPTNTGKTHLAIERLCAHSSGAIGFPLRLLAREVYDKVRAIKGDAEVALITGEERIEPPGARWLLCTAEAMPVLDRDLAFVALDEAQLAADPERGHIFTDRLLHARGREETMLLGSATLEPLVRSLLPKAEIVGRPRFSTLRHAGTAKLSRLPPRSAIVAFSAEQVYATAEMLRRHRGGAAVVMGALSPETRNRQVELFQSGEVDYIVATDAIGMGLNLDVTHVAFAGLSKFDGNRQRRLAPAEIAQIAGRAGRHHQDGTFGTLSGSGGSNELTEEEVYAVEEHRFAPLAKLFWREAEPRFSSLATLIADLKTKPGEPGLAPAPEAIDLAVLKRLSEEPMAADIRGAAMVRRFWDACSLPDFRQQGAETHSRFVSRLWQDLRQGYLGADFVAARITELDNVQGGIDTLQGRIAAIRSWAYIAQRPDWVLAREEMAARARAAEARLSDALHARLTERFVNRRTSVLMKTLAKDPALLRVSLEDDGKVLVEGEHIGHLEGFRFVVDAAARMADHKLLLAAAERHLPQLLAHRAHALVENELGHLELGNGTIRREGVTIALLKPGKLRSRPRLELARELAALPQASRQRLGEALELWLEDELAPLGPLRKLEEAALSPEAGSEVRALLLKLVDGGGIILRDASGLAHVPPEKRSLLRRLGVTIGALDVFVPALLKPRARQLLQLIDLCRLPLAPAMPPVAGNSGRAPAGYRRAGKQAIRVDMAERILRHAHEQRAACRGKKFTLDPSLAISMGLTRPSAALLLRDGGFRSCAPRPLATDAHGPPAPAQWEWRPPRREVRPQARPESRPVTANAFAGLLDLVR